ncbi:hypothetical protein NQ314_010379 [Rhamnusium bicolor]|uniref:Reverse transcriptase n=1 Tax=Rhamnusium bicolor TaxID=1586634 RepID=A0AAV8XSN5_9CUCU|nr:hypothetical protein NQ314_010379 [Rhamnusium bicolor]
MVTAEDEDDLTYRVNESLRRIDYWMENHCLELAPQKTEAVILKGPSGAVKYLGITIDVRGSYGCHIINVAKKAENRAAGLMRIMPNIRGPSSGKREILCGVVHSTILYGAPIWCEALRIRRYRTMLEGVQRRMLLRVGSAYRTTSPVALQVITGVIPIDLMVEERRYLYEMANGQELAIRKAAGGRVLNLWQRRWELNDEKGQWTKRLIPDLRPWVTYRHRRIDFYISQFLTGHGSFGTYTQRLGISENAFCVYCGEEDSPEHTVLYCHRWAPYRIAIYGELGFQLTAETLVAHMIEDKRQGNTIGNMIRTIMQDKEKERRAREN